MSDDGQELEQLQYIVKKLVKFLSTKDLFLCVNMTETFLKVTGWNLFWIFVEQIKWLQIFAFINKSTIYYLRNL
jgi:hypothetical protein